MGSFNLNSGPFGLLNINKPPLDTSENDNVSANIGSLPPSATQTSTLQIRNQEKEDGINSATILSHPKLPQEINKHRSRPEYYTDDDGVSASGRQTGSVIIETSIQSSAQSPLSLRSADVNKDLLQKDQDQMCNELCGNKSLAEIVDDGTKWKPEKVDEGWVQVQRKKLRNQFIGKTGSAPNKSGKFKAAEVRVPLFIYNVAKDVTEMDIKEYIYSKTKEQVLIYKLKMRRAKNYDSYKIFVSKSKLAFYLDDKLWPADIKFRQFINFRDSVSTNRKQI